jgi:ferredoxin-type protein NapH
MNRKLIQLIFFIIQNPFISNFLTGRPHTGATKSFCAPGLHCYSCPSMAFGCPLGVLQYVMKYARMIPYYAIGTLAAIGAIFGSATCGYVCPFGFFQEILHSISPWKTNKSALPRSFRYTKWGVFIVLVILVPALGIAQGFCAWLCPSGTIFAGLPLIGANEGLRTSIGVTFYWKLALSILIILYVMREKRAFCRYLCPLGLMLGFFNKISLYQIKLDKNKCTTCKACQKSCPMGLDLPKEINSIDCIKCGECIPACPSKFNALSKGFVISEQIIKTSENSDN